MKVGVILNSKKIIVIFAIIIIAIIAISIQYVSNERIDATTNGSNTNAAIGGFYFDSCSVDNSSNYYIPSGNNITYDTNHYIINYGNEYRFIGLNANSDLLNGLKGQNVKFSVSLEASTPTSLVMLVDGEVVTSKSISGNETTETVETDAVSIPSNVTSVDFRIVGTANSTVNFKNFLVYVC